MSKPSLVLIGSASAAIVSTLRGLNCDILIADDLAVRRSRMKRNIYPVPEHPPAWLLRTETPEERNYYREEKRLASLNDKRGERW